MILKMSEIDLAGKRVLIREDFNVPMQNGKITNDARIKAAIPTLKAVLKAGGLPIVMSHLGRPTPGKKSAEFSLLSVAHYLQAQMGVKVHLVESWLEDLPTLPGEIILTENVRFLAGEEENDGALAQKMANKCDVFVMDAFATAHRAQASTAGVAKYAKVACAGPLLVAEIEALQKIMTAPKSPIAAVIGGAKVSTKMDVLLSLLKKVDILVVGGGMANTFLKAKGLPVGQSLYEADYVATAKKILEEAKALHKQIVLPIDVVIAKEISPDAAATIVDVANVPDDMKIGDIGPKTIAQLEEMLATVNTIVWNGPVGVFEMTPFSAGTIALAKAIANSKAFSVAGGGDTLSALELAGSTFTIDYVSTGGGAFLEYLEGKILPGIAALER